MWSLKYSELQLRDFGVPCLLMLSTNSKKGAPGGSSTDSLACGEGFNTIYRTFAPLPARRTRSGVASRCRTDYMGVVGDTDAVVAMAQGHNRNQYHTRFEADFRISRLQSFAREILRQPIVP